MNNTNVNTFLGFVPNNENGWSFITTVREAIKGTSVRLKPFGRNKNRRQHAKTPHQHTKFRCNLPLKHATHYGLYLYAKNGKVEAGHLAFAKYVADHHRILYDQDGLDLSV